jgi:hypothetical protein
MKKPDVLEGASIQEGLGDFIEEEMEPHERNVLLSRAYLEAGVEDNTKKEWWAQDKDFDTGALVEFNREAEMFLRQKRHQIKRTLGNC